MTDPTDTRHLAYRVRVLPSQLQRARRRVRELEAEAERYRMFDLIADGEAKCARK